MTTINVSAGAREYVGGTITEINGKDISGDAFEMALSSTLEAPTTGWSAADVSSAGASTASRIVKLLVTDAVPIGTYSAWVRLTDTPEVITRMIQNKIIVK